MFKDSKFFPTSAPFVGARNRNYLPTTSWEDGPIELGKGDLSPYIHPWKAWTSDGYKVHLQKEGEAEILKQGDCFFLHTGSRPITELDLSFSINGDANFVLYDNQDAYLMWYNPIDETFKVDPLTYAKHPRISLDDKRPKLRSDADLIIGYINKTTGKLGYRVQRERYLDEHLINEAPVNKILWKMGMCTDYMFAFQLR